MHPCHWWGDSSTAICRRVGNHCSLQPTAPPGATTWLYGAGAFASWNAWPTWKRCLWGHQNSTNILKPWTDGQMENHRNRGPCFFFCRFFLQLVFAHSLCLSCYMGGSISFVVGSLQGWEDREWLWLHANRCLTCTIPVILKPCASRYLYIYIIYIYKIVKCKKTLEQLQTQVVQTSTYLWVWCHIERRHALMPWTTSNLVRHPWFRWTLLRPMKGKQACGMQIFHLRFARRITLPETNSTIAPENGWD